MNKVGLLPSKKLVLCAKQTPIECSFVGIGLRKDTRGKQIMRRGDPVHAIW